MKEIKRVAIVLGAGFTPGVNAIIIGAAISAHRLGWQVVGIMDGFEGLLFPERYPNKGLIDLNADAVGKLNPLESDAMGTASMVDPFNVRSINDLDMVEEVDMSDVLLQNLKKENVDAVIAIMMGRGLSILHKLNLKGLQSVCIPRSVENDMAATAVSFGFNSALSFTIEMLDRAKGAAKSAQKVAVIEVLGAQSGWLALQSGTAVLADAVIIPEFPCDVHKLAEHLKSRINRDRPYGLVVVAEGASFTNQSGAAVSEKAMALKKALSPLATEEESGQFVINRSGKAAVTLSNALQQIMTNEIFPLVLGPWTRGGAATAVDRQLGLGYGSAAIRALKSGQFGTMVSFMPPVMQFVPLIDSLNKVRTVHAESYFIDIAHSLGIFTGE
jgi:ATP-dependent phosphofructokinase / diphosphate-dependent phosphofructokinase